MEDDDDFEVIRLKKLLEDSIIQVEKENMAILQQSSKTQNTTNTTRRTIKIGPSIKAAHSVKENGLDINSSDIHSRIHFLNDLQSSLLPTSRNKQILVNDTRNRYIPCAIPLSPPVRLKREESGEITYSASSNQNYVSEGTLLKHTCQESLPIPMCNKSTEKDITVMEKNLIAPSNYSKMKNFALSLKETQVKDSCQNTSFVYRERSFPSGFSNSFSDKKFDSKEQFSESKSKEKLSQDKDVKPGLHLQISLDSCSAKDVINKVLHKIPEFVDKLGSSANDMHSFSSTEQREEIGQHSHTDSGNTNNFLMSNKMSKTQIQTVSSYTQTVPKIFNVIPEFSDIPVKQNQTVSSSTQTVSENSSNIHKFIKISPGLENENKVASSTQTNQNKEEFTINRKDLYHLVKGIVVETLQTMQPCDVTSSNTKSLPLYQKVDSGIQSEVENDILDFNRQHRIEMPNKDIFLTHGSNASRDNISFSKGVQVDLNCVQIIQEKQICDKSCNTENLKDTFEIPGINSLPYYDTSSIGNLSSERNLSLVQEPGNKFELMLEKIYDHICQDKEMKEGINDKPSNNPFLTREVAVQFKPLDTCTKSTLTSEVKMIDCSSQYDIHLKTDFVQKSVVHASIQTVTESSDQNHPKVNAYTQCEQKAFLDSVVQTELLLNMEQSATNTSVSSTPVSDSMFMDDMLSEGELPLPWNLRLLSLSGGNLNNTDSTDTSIKERDYSLSEGEIPPNVVFQHLNKCHCTHSEEYDSLHDTYSTKFASDIDKPQQSNTNIKSLRLRLSNSSTSESEYNTNTSLSLGEISPGYKVSFSDLPINRDSNPSTRSTSKDKVQCDHLSPSCAQTGDILEHSCNSDFSEGEYHRGNEQTEMQNSSRIVLHTVEELHSIYD